MKQRMAITIPILLLFAACDSLLNQNANKAYEYNEKALEYYQQGDYDMARSYFRKASGLRDVPDLLQADIYRNYSLTFGMEGPVDSTIIYLRKSNEHLEPGTYLYLVNEGDIALEFGHVNKALPLLMRAEALEQDDFRASNLLGLIYLGNYDDEHANLNLALRYNKQAHSINPDIISTEVLAINYLLLENFEKAEEYFSELSESLYSETYYTVMHGYTRFKQGFEEEAEKIWMNELVIDTSYLWLVNEMRADTSLVY